MNSSYNYSDFVGLSVESSDDHKPYGYEMEALQTYDAVEPAGADKSIESVIFARNIDRHFYD